VYKTTYSQPQKEFEGVIWYKIDYFNPDGTDCTDHTKMFLGNYIKIYIKEGRFLQNYPQSPLSDYYFNTKTNKTYSKFIMSDSIYVRSLEIEKYPALSSQKVDTSIIILGYLCKGYRQISAIDNSLFFYAEDLFQSPKYVNKKFLGETYNRYVADTRSIYLKRVTIEEDLIIVMTAFSIQSKKLSNKTFKLPHLPRVFLAY
jgi:hypothetical protein